MLLFVQAHPPYGVLPMLNDPLSIMLLANVLALYVLVS